jgi:hypothetical protein
MSHDDSEHACACGGNCGCQNSQQAETVSMTREEYAARLEQYLLELKAEIVAVEKELLGLKIPAEMVKA